jgi:hypothetical protein
MESSVDTQSVKASIPTATTTNAPQAISPLPDVHSLKCSSCNGTINSQYVRALGGIYHATCFRCMVRLCGHGRIRVMDFSTDANKVHYLIGLQRYRHCKILLLHPPKR